MSETFALKPTHKAVRAYYLALAQLANVGAKHETAVREAWHNLIEAAAGPLHWTLVREYAINRRYKPPLRLDGALVDPYRLVHGVIESKDDADDLETEIRSKIRSGYPIENTLFWQPGRAILMQDGKLSKAAFGLTPSEYAAHKGLERQNLRDHMADLELIFSMLGEAATTEITRTKEVQGFPANQAAASEGGTVAGNARRELERKSGRKVVSRENYLDASESAKRLPRGRDA